MTSTPAPALLDHLVYACDDLERGVDMLEARLGVRASAGGRHPTLGTWNALLSLGRERYLEIIAPDPAQRGFRGTLPFGIDSLKEPALTAWAARCADVPARSALDLGRGQRLGRPAVGHRAGEDGTLLEWTFTDPRTRLLDGLVPFFIDWGRSPHPSVSAAGGLALVDLRAEHPRPGRVRRVLERLGIDLVVDAAPAPGLIATIDGPGGQVILR